MKAFNASPARQISANLARLAWVTGAGGLIGSEAVRAASACAPGWRARGLLREELDLCDFDEVRRAFARERPQLVIHCAALSRSPACQASPELARRINVEATAHLAELAAEIQFIFLSSDLIFDGRTGSYSETSPANPLSIYAETKVLAEQIILANPKHTVIRTSLNGGTSPTGDRGCNEQLRLAWKKGERPRLFTDEFRSPLPAAVTARGLWEIASKELAGVYHLAGTERLSRWRIGQLLAARWPQLHPQIEAASTRDYSGPPRPPDTSLDCAKVQQVLSFRLPGLAEWLEAHPEEVF